MDYFPQALASGESFCNRVAEQKRLAYNLHESRPTLIASPRRYGKTSLALHTIKKQKFHYAKFDFLSAISVNDIEKIILKGVGRLLGQIETGPQKLLKLATDLFSGLSIKLSSDILGLSIEINKKTEDPARNILNILERIEKLSEKMKNKVILLFDEFQRIYQIVENPSIESVIREVAQASQSLSFIFSGSNRHLLNQMFNDRNRPFYKLCDRITLNRISENDYINYLEKVAKKTNRSINDDIIKKIFHYTERHPYYMNLLCSRLWQLNKITEDSVSFCWENYAVEERSQVGNELDLLSKTQRKLLATLARSGGSNAPRSKAFQLQADMAGATITQALSFLEKKDYVYRDKDDYYQVLDPIIKYILSSEE